MGIGELKISKFDYGIAFSGPEVFLSFSTFQGIFVNRSFLPNFCVLRPIVYLLFEFEVSFD